MAFIVYNYFSIVKNITDNKNTATTRNQSDKCLQYNFNRLFNISIHYKQFE